MKKLTVALLLFLSYCSFATHEIGGQVYWVALGNNQYDIYLEKLVDVGSSRGGQKAIYIDTTLVYAQPDTSYTITVNQGCTSTTNYSLKVHIYKAAGVTIIPNSTAPIIIEYRTGFNRGYASNATSNGLAVYQSKLYPAGANASSAIHVHSYFHYTASRQFQFKPVVPGGGNVDVSLFPPVTEFAGTRNGPVYVGSFTNNHPITPTDQMSAQGLLVTGPNPPTGTYIVGVKATLTNAIGQVMSEVGLDSRVSIPATTSSNSAPNIGFSSISGNSQSLPNNAGTQINAEKGDTIYMNVHGLDSDLNSGGIPQSITASALGLSNLPGTPIFAPLAPQSSNVASATNNMSFEWVIPTNIPAGTYQVLFTMSDNGCPIAASNTSILSIVIDPDTTSINTIASCINGSVTLSAPIAGSNYQWSPTVGLSSDSTSTTIASPTSTTTYQIAVDGDVVGFYTVNVSTPETPLTFRPQPNQIQLANSQDFDRHVFLYYFVPYAIDSVIAHATLPGTYHVGGQNGGCMTYTDSIKVNLDSTWKTGLIDAPLTVNDFIQVNSQSTYEMELTLGSSTDSYHITKIILPGATFSSGASVELLATDDSGVQQTIPAQVNNYALIFQPSSPLVFTNGSGLVELKVNSGTGNVALKSNVTLPYQLNQATLSAINASIGGTTVNDHLLPLVFEGYSTIGIEELSTASVLVYPQPATDILRIENVEENTAYQVIEMNGRVVSTGMLQNGSIDVSSLASGAYLLRINSESNPHTTRFVVQK